MIAVLLLRWFGVEFSRIPSSSMQPALLGADETGVADGVLVDKLRYLLTEPQRWDLLAFHPTLRTPQTFVKRLVGLPGERITIRGGNVMRVATADPSRLEVVRRPAALLARQWRDVHPGRQVARDATAAVDAAWRCEPAAAWRTRDEGLFARLTTGQPARLHWVDPDGGLVDRAWDGLPPNAARAVRAVHFARSEPAEIVADARLRARVQASHVPLRVEIAIEVHRPEHATLRFACEHDEHGITLVVRRGDEVVAANRSRPMPWPQQQPVTIEFAHVDEELIAWRDGVEVARLGTSSCDVRSGCELPDPCGMGPAMPRPDHCAEVSLTLFGDGDASLHDLRIWRDQHWTRGPLPADSTLTIPSDHYLVLGDNPLQSMDGRGMPAFAIGDLDGVAVPADTPGCMVRVGPLQAGEPERPSRDENPIVFEDRRELLLTDRFGNAEILHGSIRFEPDGAGLTLLQPRADGVVSEYPLAVTAPMFVARSEIVGRVIARYWPWPPFGPWRDLWLR